MSGGVQHRLMEGDPGGRPNPDPLPASRERKPSAGALNAIVYLQAGEGREVGTLRFALLCPPYAVRTPR